MPEDLAPPAEAKLTDEDFSWLLPEPESPGSKLTRKVKENPFVPLGEFFSHRLFEVSPLPHFTFPLFILPFLCSSWISYKYIFNLYIVLNIYLYIICTTGCGLTVLALVYGLAQFKRGHQRNSQMAMRMRVLAQGGTLIAVLGGLFFSGVVERRDN